MLVYTIEVVIRTPVVRLPNLDYFSFEKMKPSSINKIQVGYHSLTSYRFYTARQLACVTRLRRARTSVSSFIYGSLL